MMATVAERLKAMTPAQAREYFTWRDAGLSMEAALGRVEVVEAATVQESDDGSEFDHLFTKPVRESTEPAATQPSSAEARGSGKDEGAEFDHLFSGVAQ